MEEHENTCWSMFITDNRKPNVGEHQVRNGTFSVVAWEGEEAYPMMQMRQRMDPPVVLAVDLGDEPSAFSHSEVVRDNNGRAGPCGCQPRIKLYLALDTDIILSDSEGYMMKRVFVTWLVGQVNVVWQWLASLCRLDQKDSK